MLQWYCPLYLLLLYFATTAVLQSDCSCCLVSRQPSPLSELLQDVGKKTESWYWDDPIGEAWSVKSTCLDLTLRANWYRTVLLFPFGFFPNMSNFYFRFLKYRLCSYPLVSFRKFSPPLPKEIRNAAVWQRCYARVPSTICNFGIFSATHATQQAMELKFPNRVLL